MEIEKLKSKVRTAVNLFIENDSRLLELNVYEPATSHRIAVYLEYLFREYHVDCEYDKHGDGEKNIKTISSPNNAREGCERISCKTWKSYRKEKGKEKEIISIRPDIIVHTRRTDENNTVAIEIKKKKECKYDKAKLRALTCENGEYKYKLGAFIYFPEGKPMVKWFTKRGSSEFEEMCSN